MPEPKWAMGWGSWRRTLAPVEGPFWAHPWGGGPSQSPRSMDGSRGREGGKGEGWVEGRLEGAKKERRGDAKREEFFFLHAYMRWARARTSAYQTVHTCSGQVRGCPASMCWFRAGVSNPKLGVGCQSWFTKFFLFFYFIFVRKRESACSSGQVCSDLGILQTSTDLQSQSIFFICLEKEIEKNQIINQSSEKLAAGSRQAYPHSRGWEGGLTSSGVSSDQRWSKHFRVNPFCVFFFFFQKKTIKLKKLQSFEKLCTGSGQAYPHSRGWGELCHSLVCPLTSTEATCQSQSILFYFFFIKKSKKSKVAKNYVLVQGRPTHTPGGGGGGLTSSGVSSDQHLSEATFRVNPFFIFFHKKIKKIKSCEKLCTGSGQAYPHSRGWGEAWHPLVLSSDQHWSNISESIHFLFFFSEKN